MFGLGITEVIIIVLAIGILLFGSKKIIELARSMGRFTGEFKKGKREIEAEIKNAEESATEAAPVVEDVSSEDSNTPKT
ncbi:twin-arginine translocase TatA/TatE family subunit [candidate division KSB1 bacterium]